MIEGGGVRKFPIFRSLKMSSPTSLKAKGKQKATGDDALNFEDLEDATNSRSSSEPSDSGSDSDSGSVSGSGSSSALGPAPGLKPKAGAKADPPLSRDDLLVYLENMRRRFSEGPTTDSFANQEEEVSIVTSKHK